MLRRRLALIATLLVLSALAIAVLLWTTRVPPQMPAKVTGDPALPWLEGDGVLRHGRLAGAEGAPLAIVLHGGPGGDHRSLLALDGLSDTHRILFYDQRGAGLSERVTKDRLGLANHLADLDALIAAHGGGRAVLIEPGFRDAEGLSAFETRRALAQPARSLGRSAGRVPRPRCHGGCGSRA